MQMKTLLATAALSISTFALASQSMAQNTGAWPHAGPITLVVPFAAGGSVDNAARVIAPLLAQRLGQNIVIENSAGAAGTIGTYKVVRAKPDGQTLLFAVSSPITVAPQVSPGIVKYDPFKDLLPITPVGVSTFVTVARADLPADTAQQLIPLLRAQPGKFTYGTDGVGTSMHIATELIKQQAGVDMLHVPYKSGPQVVADLAGGQIDLATMPVSLVQPLIHDGKIKAIGVTSRQRWPSLPDTPSLSETPQLKNLALDSWYGLLAPAGTAPAITERLVREIATILKDPATLPKLRAAGLEPLRMDSTAFARYLDEEWRTLGAVIASANIKP
ncbi:MAG: tripartite tricarboxylate transporter substrate binding protein [Pigmentiphaga sp.]|uniref:Bug family tripartite tricarboxylate transporter substrate binding protein n=1 Tax=Pigmentiphaga sp. TaxID=1977564 RepID=UPI0029BABC51|nr:tripartite tricarboxylate transporter substrate binding protein [Pigmentiphaga sp.]MDX3905656.1 tripartite tricarboxylate transporter substrate binding protein [Pigmentiphaga sp.]